MAGINYQKFAFMVQQKRGEKTLRVLGAELGLSASTLHRIELGHVSDLETFLQLCHWLEVNPHRFYTTLPGPDQEPAREELLGVLLMDEALPLAVREAFVTLLREAYDKYPTLNPFVYGPLCQTIHFPPAPGAGGNEL